MSKRKSDDDFEVPRNKKRRSAPSQAAPSEMGSYITDDRETEEQQKLRRLKKKELKLKKQKERENENYFGYSNDSNPFSFVFFVQSLLLPKKMLRIPVNPRKKHTKKTQKTKKKQNQQ